jgi:hypothetical protein
MFSEDLYVVLDNCYNPHGSSGHHMRIYLHSFLYEKSYSHWLCDFFLSNDATNNTCFCQSKTLKDLQASKGFNLMCVFDGNDENFSMMCPDVILPSVGLLYKTNIFYIDLDKDMSYLHLYDKNSSKIITYSFQGTTKSPSKIWKYKTFLKKNENFKFVDYEAESLAQTQNASSSSLLFLGNKKLYTTLSKHPQGRLQHSVSFPFCLRSLLQSNNIDHEHFRNNKGQDDILDICVYTTELLSSFPENDLSYFFHNEIIQLMRKKDVISLASLLEKFQSPLTYNHLSHCIVCPIMCLKYNLWISVWEDDKVISTTSSKLKKSRNTYFYWYDHTKDIVDCKVFSGQYVHLPHQSHILYVRFSETLNRFGYWKQEELNPFTRSQDLYSYSHNLKCKYSYLDGPLKLKVIELFQNYFKMNIISEESPYSRTLYHGNSINPTLVPIVFANINKKGLFVIFPFDEKDNMYFGCFIHNNVPTNVIHEKIEFFKSKIGDHTMPPHFSFKHISINCCDFGLSFQMIVLMFIASTSRNVRQLVFMISKMNSESDIVDKSKQWLSNWLSDSFYNPNSTLIIPQWLQQIICYEAPSHAIQQVQESIAEREQISRTNEQSGAVGVSNDTNTTKKRKLLKSSHEQQILDMNSDIYNNSTSEVHSYLECSTKYNTEPYVNFISFVESMAKLERNYFYQKKKSKNIQAHNFNVVIFDNKSISAMNFVKITDHDWIGDEVVDYIGKTLMYDHNSSHIFSTQFMTNLLNDISNVKTWHTQMSIDVNSLYIPIHKDGNHWLLSRIDFKEKQILLWNSSYKIEDHSNYLNKLMEYIVCVQDQLVQANEENSKWHGNWTVQDKSCNCPKQCNFDDCGIFTILNLVLLINEVDLSANSYSQELIDNFNTRVRIAQIVHQHSKNLMSSQMSLFTDRYNDDDDDVDDDDDDDDDDNDVTKKCQICNLGGEMIVCHSGRHWTGCGKFFHINCAKRTEVPHGDWICMTCAETNRYNVDIQGYEFSVEDESMDLSSIENMELSPILDSEDQEDENDEEKSGCGSVNFAY